MTTFRPAPDPGYGPMYWFWILLVTGIVCLVLAFLKNIPGGPWKPLNEPTPTPTVSIAPSRS